MSGLARIARIAARAADRLVHRGSGDAVVRMARRILSKPTADARARAARALGFQAVGGGVYERVRGEYTMRLSKSDGFSRLAVRSSSRPLAVFSFDVDYEVLMYSPHSRESRPPESALRRALLRTTNMGFDFSGSVGEVTGRAAASGTRAPRA